VAVFPDRIVLKNSTDSQAIIEAAIGSGGTDQITQGEVVVGLEANAATFYTIDGSGNVVTIGSAAGSISSLGDLTDVDLTTPATNGQVIAYNSTSGNWEPVDQSGGGATSIDDLTDVDTTTTPPTDGQVLTWDNANSKWEPADAVGGIAAATITPAGTQELLLDFSQYSAGTTFDSVDPGASTWTLMNSSQIITSWAKFPGGALDCTTGNRWIQDLGAAALQGVMTGDLVVALWINKNANQNGSIIYFASDSNTDNIVITGNTDGSITANIGRDTDGTLTSSVLSNGDHHLALTRSGQIVTLYVDGVADGSYDAGVVRTLDLSSGDRKSIGALYNLPSFNFNGYIADVGVFSGTPVWTSNFTPPDNNVAYFQGLTGGLANGQVGDVVYDTDGKLYSATSASTWDKVVAHPSTLAPADGQVLTWDNANSQWEPGDLQGAAVRAALGIGEYVDDAAAGTGGVASGALYYNTTSSDYRLKT